METTSAGPVRTRVALLVVGGIIAVAAGIVGIDDNPVGIALAYAGAFLVVLAFVFQWRSPWRFVRLMAWAVLSFLALALIHNLAYGAAEAVDVTVVRGAFTVISVVAFLLAVMVCPAAVVVGAAGALTTWLKGRR